MQRNFEHLQILPIICHDRFKLKAGDKIPDSTTCIFFVTKKK